VGLINHVSRVLRPGGLIDFSDFDFHVYDEHKQRIEAPTSYIGAPWLSRWMAFTNLAVRQRGGSTDAATHLHSWISHHQAFEQVVSKTFWIPASPWIRGDDPESVRQRGFGAAMRDDILVCCSHVTPCTCLLIHGDKAFLKSARPLLLGSGLPEVLVNELEQHARVELLESRIPYWIRIEEVYAIKRADV
jgi:hypothetical protein